MRQALTVLRILDFLAFADILAVSANCNLFKHTEKLLGSTAPKSTSKQ